LITNAEQIKVGCAQSQGKAQKLIFCLIHFKRQLVSLMCAFIEKQLKVTIKFAKRRVESQLHLPKLRI